MRGEAKKMNLARFFPLIAICLPSVCHAASFDCTEAADASARAICNSLELSKKDEAFARLYRSRHAALKNDPAAYRAFVVDGRRWLAMRAACAGDIGCLEVWYASRLASLSDVPRGAPLRLVAPEAPNESVPGPPPTAEAGAPRPQEPPKTRPIARTEARPPLSPDSAAAPARAIEPAVVAPPAPVPAKPLSDQDIAQIVDVSRHNEMRFDRDYKGKLFEAPGTFERAARGLIDAERYRIAVETPGGDVDCITSDTSVLDLAANWKSGQPVTVSGRIETTSMGDIELYYNTCRLSAR
jgi:uncharacterized protein